MRNSAHIPSTAAMTAAMPPQQAAAHHTFSERPVEWRRLSLAAILVVAVVIGSALLCREWFAQATLADLRQSSSFSIAGTASALQTKLQKFRLVPIALSTDPELRSALETPTEYLRESLNARFEEIAAASGAAAIYLIDSSGVTFAASNYRSERSFIGQNYSFRSYFQQALENREAEEFAFGTVSGAPGLYLSRSIASESGEARGVIVVKLRFDDIESYWRDQDRLIVAADSTGRIIVTPREALRFQELGPVAGGVLKQPPAAVTAYVGAGPVLAAVHSIPEGGWVAASLLPLQPALGTARLAGLLTGASLSGLALSGLGLLLHRIARNARRDRAVAAYRAHLETEVETRTEELQASYRQLTEETARREQAQAELRFMQDEITQLNRLAILGQLAAKFAHEINQPLTAMRNYVENSMKLLAMGDGALVGRNLETMSGLMTRARRITDELREFSRLKPSAVSDIPVGDAIDGALLIASHALQASSIAVNRSRAADDALVCVDKIRLEQVVLNVVQNAIDEVRDLPSPQIRIATEAGPGWVTVTIADNGTGVENVDDLFVPFRSGKHHGLGLGLSISSEILSEYGGDLSYNPEEGGGARFVIRLPRGKK